MYSADFRVTEISLYFIILVRFRLDISIRKLAGLVEDGALSMVGRKRGMSSLIASDVRNKTKFLKMTNVFTAILKLVKFVRSKGINVSKIS
jgi:hypothetical protein